MNDRRSFLKAGLGSAIAMYLPGATYSQTSAKQIRLDGRLAKVVDIHAHCEWPEAGELLKGTPLENKQFRDFVVVGPRRIEQMDERGIDVQVLSINGFWWYTLERDLAGKLVRLHDEKLSEWCKQHSDRFVALTSVAMQYPDLAAQQLEYAVNELDLRGASVGGHVNGESLSNPRFDPFWAKAEELGVPVFMHPRNSDTLVVEDGLSGNGDLGNIIGNPLETTVFLTKLIFDGTLDKFPGLKIVASHSGGYLPSYLGRTEVACEVRPNVTCANKKKPSEYLKDQIMVDSMIFSEEGLRHLVAEVGPGQVVYGSDLPFSWPDTIDLIANSPTLSNAEKEAILGGNLISLLKL